MTTFELLKSKWELVKPGANVFGGGIWNPDNDLNWAFQQIRPNGKPAGDVPEMNQKAALMLQEFIPTLKPEEAGSLVQEIHILSDQCVKLLIMEFEEQGYSYLDALQKSKRYCLRTSNLRMTKYYVVWKGRLPGIYNTWTECNAQVIGYPGAEFKSFKSKEEAEAAYGKQKSSPKKVRLMHLKADTLVMTKPEHDEPIEAVLARLLKKLRNS